MRLKLVPCLLVALWTATPAPAPAESELDPSVINTSTNCQGAFEDYKRRFAPLYFARAVDGSSCSYSYCESGCNPTNMREKTLYACSRAADGIACQISGFAGKPVEVEEVAQQPK